MLPLSIISTLVFSLTTLEILSTVELKEARLKILDTIGFCKILITALERLLIDEIGLIVCLF